ncbi:hypothetical protein J8273_7436 [Carpediemonas membranifera]|uniref:Uncharacterized protein n=1 Tax=Carpediemonas membranifera TaxID=201153 RepID=A0A8J6E1W6_9EUKA|nr:hypothetical protein J8273_7436 [Carpediemonas membranifera]|eukprot:KAG9391162.1 hypothetical protein J8273_7436 [Carpediemonas membranifera]
MNLFRLTIRGKQNRLKFTGSLRLQASNFEDFNTLAREFVQGELSHPNVAKHYAMPDELCWYIRTKKREAVSDFAVLTHANFHVLCNAAVHNYATVPDPIDVSCCLTPLDREAAPKSSVRTVPSLAHRAPPPPQIGHDQGVPQHLPDTGILGPGLPELPATPAPPHLGNRPPVLYSAPYFYVPIDSSAVPTLRNILDRIMREQGLGLDDELSV